MYKACSNCGASRGTLGYVRGSKYCKTCQEYETEAEQQAQQIADLKAQVAELIEAADHVCQVSGRTGIVRLREAVAKAGGE